MLPGEAVGDMKALVDAIDVGEQILEGMPRAQGALSGAALAARTVAGR